MHSCTDGGRVFFPPRGIRCGLRTRFSTFSRAYPFCVYPLRMPADMHFFPSPLYGTQMAGM